MVQKACTESLTLIMGVFWAHHAVRQSECHLFPSNAGAVATFGQIIGQFDLSSRLRVTLCVQQAEHMLVVFRRICLDINVPFK